MQNLLTLSDMYKYSKTFPTISSSTNGDNTHIICQARILRLWIWNNNVTNWTKWVIAKIDKRKNYSSNEKFPVSCHIQTIESRQSL